MERISHTSIVDTIFPSSYEEWYYKGNIADLNFYLKYGATRLNIVERSPSREYYQYQRFDYENMYKYAEDSAMQIIRRKKANRSETMFIELLSDSACQKWERAYFAVYQDSKTDKLIRVKEVHYSYGEKVDTQRHYVYVPYFVPLQKEMPQPTEAYCWHCLADTATWQLLFTTLHDKEGNLLVWEHTYWIAKIQRLHACFFLHGVKNMRGCGLRFYAKQMANIPISPNIPAFDARLRIAYDSAGLPQKVDIPNERIYRFYPGFYDYYPFKQSNLLEHCVADFYFSQDDGRGNWEKCAVAPRCKKGEHIVIYPNGKQCDCCGDTMRVERKITYYPDE